MNEVETRVVNELIEAAWDLVEHLERRCPNDLSHLLRAKLEAAERVLPSPAASPTA